MSKSEFTPQTIEACQKIAGWARSFLTEPHQDLGREGPVCPFTQPSLEKRLFWLALYEKELDDEQTAKEVVHTYMDWFLRLEPTEGHDVILKTVLILFPTLSATKAADILLPLQKRLKPEFVKSGLMVGQFYEGCIESGLWNKQFYPLQAPVPLLAIRHMVPSDLPFLRGGRGSPEMLVTYFHRFGHEIPGHIRKQIIQALEEYDEHH